jgi:hypothetical protein
MVKEKGTQQFLIQEYYRQGKQDSQVCKSVGLQAERDWVRSSPRPQKALNLSD